MLNSEFISQRSKGLATLLLKDTTISDSERIERAFLAAFARKPMAGEIDKALNYIAALQEKIGSPEAKAYAWQSYCQILMASNEFAYIE